MVALLTNAQESTRSSENRKFRNGIGRKSAKRRLFIRFRSSAEFRDAEKLDHASEVWKCFFDCHPSSAAYPPSLIPNESSAFMYTPEIRVLDAVFCLQLPLLLYILVKKPHFALAISSLENDFALWLLKKEIFGKFTHDEAWEAISTPFLLSIMNFSTQLCGEFKFHWLEPRNSVIGARIFTLTQCYRLTKWLHVRTAIPGRMQFSLGEGW